MDKKKVLIFLQAGVGGAERMSVAIGKMLDVEKYTVKFFLIHKGTVNSKIRDFIPENYSVTDLGSGNPLKIIFRLICTIGLEKPAIVFSSVLYLNNKILPFSFLFPKTKFIVRCENYLFTFSKKQKAVIKLVYNNADAIIAQTQEMKEELVNEANISADKVFTLENPLDTGTIDRKIENSKSPYPDDGKQHIVASGRFAYQKGFDLLVEAFAKIALSNGNIDLYIIGAKDGHHENEFNRVWSIVESYGLQERVHCLGFQNNPYQYVKYAGCFVLSSRWEGLPNVLIEALYLGTPVAAFECIPIVRRIVDNGKTGFIAEKENTDSLAKSILQAIKLGRVSSGYRGSKPQEFISLFDSLVNE